MVNIKKLSLGVIPLVIGVGAYKYINTKTSYLAQKNSQALTMNKPLEITTPSGLTYIITHAAPATAAQPQRGKQVTVHYTGYLRNPDGSRGTKFDSSVDRGTPFKFIIGVGQVIAGWDEGVMGMRVGEKRTLIIPANLGYGAYGAGKIIPGGATLIFDVELLAV
jgi:FKBP-type peptidyl-prolyl cis-trans isomerase